MSTLTRYPLEQPAATLALPCPSAAEAEATRHEEKAPKGHVAPEENIASNTNTNRYLPHKKLDQVPILAASASTGVPEPAVPIKDGSDLMSRGETAPSHARANMENNVDNSKSTATSVVAVSTESSTAEASPKPSSSATSTTPSSGTTSTTDSDITNLLECLRQKNFAQKLHALVTIPTYSAILRWQPAGDSFAIYNTSEFVDIIMSTHFQRAKFDSFTRRMHRWGFRQMESVEEKMKGTVIYKCKSFLRDKPELCKMMCDDGGGGGGNKRPTIQYRVSESIGVPTSPPLYLDPWGCWTPLKGSNFHHSGILGNPYVPETLS